MSLDVTIYKKIVCKCGEYYKGEQLYSSNITHNLGSMAKQAGIYEALWSPYMLKEGYIKNYDYKLESQYEKEQTISAKDLIPIIAKGLEIMKKRPEYFKKFDSQNGRGLYDNFVPWIEEYLENLVKYEDGTVEVSR